MFPVVRQPESAENSTGLPLYTDRLTEGLQANIKCINTYIFRYIVGLFYKTMVEIVLISSLFMSAMTLFIFSREHSKIIIFSRSFIRVFFTGHTVLYMILCFSQV